MNRHKALKIMIATTVMRHHARLVGYTLYVSGPERSPADAHLHKRVELESRTVTDPETASRASLGERSQTGKLVPSAIRNRPADSKESEALKKLGRRTGRSVGLPRPFAAGKLQNQIRDPARG